MAQPMEDTSPSRARLRIQVPSSGIAHGERATTSRLSTVPVVVFAVRDRFTFKRFCGDASVMLWRWNRGALGVVDGRRVSVEEIVRGVKTRRWGRGSVSARGW